MNEDDKGLDVEILFMCNGVFIIWIQAWQPYPVSHRARAGKS